MGKRVAAIALLAVSASAAFVASAGVASARSSAIAFNGNDLSTWQTDGIVWTLASTGNTVFAGGTFSGIRPPGATDNTNEQPAANFAAFDASTGAPTNCRLSFTLGSGTATVRALDVSPDGSTLYAGGLFSAVNGVSVSNLAAIDVASCTPIASFRPFVSATVRAIDSTGSAVYVGGDLTAAGTTSGSQQSRGRLASFSPSGSLLPWAPNVELPVRTVAVTPDNRVIVGGDFFNLNGAASHALGVVDGSSGATLKTFPNFYETNSAVKKVRVSGNAFYVANEGTGPGVFDGRTAVSLSDYSQIWRDTCLGATQSLVVFNNVLYSASHAHDCSSMGEWPDGARQHFIAQTTSSPTTKLPWYPNTNEGLGEGIGPRDLVIAGGGNYLWSGGEFTTVNGHAQQGLTRFGNGPDTTTPSVPIAFASSYTAGAITVRWRSSVDPDDATLTYRVFRDGTLIRTITSDSAWWRRPQLAVTDGGLAVGSTHTYRVDASDGTSTSAQSAPSTVQVVSARPAYAAAVLASGPTTYWRLDEPNSTFAADLSPSSNGGIVPSTATRSVAGALRNDPNPGITLNGSSNVAQELRQNSPTTYSAEAWFKTSTTSGGKILGFGTTQSVASKSYDKHVYMTNTGKLVFGVWVGGPVTITTPGSYNNNVWHQVVITQGSGGMALYVDGKLIGTNPQTRSATYNGFWRAGGDAVASNWPSAPTSGFLAGSIDDVSIYPSVLSSGTVAQHYSASGR